MLLIERRHIRHIQTAARAEDLHESLQAAIELEHSTLPPYLTALFSLHPGKNSEIREVLRSVVIEEMLHLTIAANTLNAIGGRPSLNGPHFVPHYPGALPMNIGHGLVVGLERYSPQVVRDIFMKIEQPEDPLHFPVASEAARAEEYGTIGEFYAALIAKIHELGDRIFCGKPERQVVDGRWFSRTELFAIHNAASAEAGLKLIVAQGEGTKKSPLDPEGEYAHYYRFEELHHGRRLVADPSVPEGYSFSGAEIPFDSQAVYPLKANTRSADLPAGSEARREANQLNYVYGKLLNALHRTFNGEPLFLNEAMALMYGLKLVAERLASMPYSGLEGVNVGPPFEYAAVNE